MTSQSFITIVRRLDRRSAEGAKEALQPYGNLHGDATCKRKVGFATALDRARIVHFLSINVEIDAGLADEATEPPRPPDAHGHLIVEIAADGSASDCLAAVAPILIAHAPDLLTAARLPSEPGELAHALAADQIAIGAGFGKAVGLPFSGAPGLSVRRILDEAELARTVAQWVFEKRDASPRDILREVRGKLWDAGEKWTIAAEPIPWLGSKPFGFWPGLIMTLLPLGLLFLIGLAVIVGALCFGLAWRWRTATLVACVVAVGVAGGLYAWFRWSESKDVPQDAAPDAGAVAAIMAQENHAAQNHLFSVSTLKASRIRRLTLRLAFFLIGGLAKYSFRPGFLQDIGSIHFARWFVISGTDRLVFLSNYGGSWEGYLEDFIERASKGLTAIWSNAIGFPRTTNLVRDGAEDGDRFKRWARRHQLPTGLWYSAYPSLTMARIRANAVIRQGIAVAATEGEAADWLACFGSAPPPPDELEAAEIPGLIFGGFSPLPYGQAIIFRLKKGGSPAEWLNLALHDLSYGQGRPDPKSGATLVAFTSTGLAEIGLSADDLATFPAAFQHGMSDPVRARALGDVDADDPKLWNWGSGDNAADGIVLVYAASPGDLNTLAARRRAELTNSGHEIITEVLFQKLKSQQNITSAPLKKDQNDRANDDLAKEPFGFADGISQPIIRGTRRYTRIRDAIHVVEPGEFILGYPDNRGRIPPSPAVGARRDPNHLLPGYGADPFRSRPDFSTPQPTGERDFGRNGTFLVVRQLSQDVNAFSEFLTLTARRLKRQHKAMAVKSTDERREWIRAKLVGRWPDGTSLVRFPTEPGTGRGRSARPDNDFLYRQDDPDGRRCPLGAHIRRANPRDSLASSNGETKVANRHRILRVGRPYADNVDDKMARGLFFMCLNADIERQFEFVQQSWVGLPTFHGLENETDCFAPRGQTTVFTVPTEKGPICLERLENFVKVIGGGYFFMPSQRALGYLASVAAAKSAPVCKPAQSEALSKAEA